MRLEYGEKYKISDYFFINYNIDDLDDAKSSYKEYTSYIKRLKEEYEKIREGALPLFRVNIAIATATFGVLLTFEWGEEFILSGTLAGVGILILCISIYLVRSVLANQYISYGIEESSITLTPETLLVSVKKVEKNEILEAYKNRIYFMRNYLLPTCLQTNYDAQAASRASYILTVGTLIGGVVFYIFIEFLLLIIEFLLPFIKPLFF